MTELCTQCHLGSPRVERVTWARLVGRQLVVVPNIEALVCETCGAVDYDYGPLGRLEALLLVGVGVGQRPRMSPTPPVPAGAWSSGRPIRAV
jgi:YgiT-type zinc finger domain-containing protein